MVTLEQGLVWSGFHLSMVYPAKTGDQKGEHVAEENLADVRFHKTVPHLD